MPGRLGHERPAALEVEREAGIGAEQGRGDAVGDGAAGLGQPDHVPDDVGGRARPLAQVAEGSLREGRHGSARESGSVMQRGPPPPRTSSFPRIAITARSFAPSVSSPVRNLRAEILRKPAFSISRSVASARSYPMMTPG